MTTLARRTVLQALGLSALHTRGETATGRPNILFLYSDDHHWQCRSEAGNPNIHTPNLDRLAWRGVDYTSGTVATAQCCPSRGVMLSGLETYQSGLLSNKATGFRSDRGPTIVQQLSKSGYDTVLVGKWHIQPTPADCGFSKAPLWLPGGGSRYLNPPGIVRGIDGTAGAVEGHVTELWSDAACEYLRSATRPFLLWVAYNAPHTPWHADRQYMDLYAGKGPSQIAAPAHPGGGLSFDWNTYYAVISQMDAGIGRVIAQLEKSGLWDNTLIVFLGDNGYMCGTKGWTGKVLPWEESIRVPYLVSRGLVKSGVKLDMPASSVDLPATWLDFAGVEPAYAMAGRSLRNVLATGTPDRDAAFVTWADGRAGALAGNRQVEPYRLVRTRRHKLIRWESGREELYDLVADPGEDKNLIVQPATRKIAADLRERLRTRMAATSDPALSWTGWNETCYKKIDRAETC